MRLLCLMVLWCVLLVLCWPLAIFVLIAFPFIWLLSLPFRLLAVLVEGIFSLLRALLLLPARLLGTGRSVPRS